MTDTPKRNPLVDTFLLESELAKRWRRSPRTLQRWRENGTSPAYLRLGGRVRSLRVAPQHDAPVLELVLDDGTAAVSVVFLGRRRLAGVRVGTRMVVEGTVGLHRNRLSVLNPTYELRL